MKAPTRAQIARGARLLKIHGTPYKLAVPNSISEYGTNNKFTVGHILCHISKNEIHTSQPLPASRCVDLSAEAAA